MIVLFCTFIVCACGSSGSNGDSNDEVTPVEVVFDSTIINPVVENTMPYGLSSFALGTIGKFPLEDDHPNASGIGYKSVAMTVRRMATNELYTFPEKSEGSDEQIYTTLKYFVDKGHIVTHEIHILNGPGIRNEQCMWLHSLVGYHPDADGFSHLLKYNNVVRNAVQNLFVAAVNHAKRIETLGNTEVLISPELEDNHYGGEEGTFGILLELLKNAGWQNSDGSLRRANTVRSTIVGKKIPSIRWEYHGDIGEVNYLRPGDIYNNDGKGYSLKSRTQSCNTYNEDQIRQYISIAQQKGVIFYAWYSPLQGRIDMDCNSQPYPNYEDRRYTMDNSRAQAAILLGINESEVATKFD